MGGVPAESDKGDKVCKCGGCVGRGNAKGGIFHPFRAEGSCEFSSPKGSDEGWAVWDLPASGRRY